VPTTTSLSPVLILALAVLIPGYAVADPPPATPPGETPSATASTPSDSPERPAAPADAELFERAGRLLQSRCAMPGCHLGPDAMQALRLEVREIYRSSVNVRARTDPRLLRLVPRAPLQSLLYLKLLPQDRGGYRGPRMPQGMNPLGDEEIEVVRKWIEAFPEATWGPPPLGEATALPARTFQDGTLVNLPTSEPLGRHALDVRILHRFKAPVAEAGSHGFYGLDSDAWVSIGLAFGLTGALEVGLRRTNLHDDFEAYAKWVLLRQASGGPPLSLALRGSVSDIREKGASNTDRQGAQMILARRFGARLSLLLVPTYVTRTNYLDAADRRGTCAVGAGAELRLNSKTAITGEWVAPLRGVENDFQSASLGYAIATARHAFEIFVTNTAGAHTDLYAPGGDLDARKGDYRLGFNISRVYAAR